MTARIPEPHTLWTVMQGTLSGIPAPSEAWRAGACPTPACSTLPITTCSISAAGTPALESAQRIAAEPSAGAGKRGQAAEKGANGGACGGENDDVFHGRAIVTLPPLSRLGSNSARTGLPWWPATLLPMRILAIDFGEKRIGLATWDASGRSRPPGRHSAEKTTPRRSQRSRGSAARKRSSSSSSVCPAPPRASSRRSPRGSVPSPEAREAAGPAVEFHEETLTSEAARHVPPRLTARGDRPHRPRLSC